MLKKINMSHIVICALTFVLSSICHAITVVHREGIVQCSPSLKKIKAIQIDGEPNKQYTITTIGMIIKGVGLIPDWDYYHEENDVVCHGTAQVMARCEFSGTEKKMYSFKSNTTAPSLSCQKGEGVIIKILSPNDADPDKYLYKYRMTAVQDEDSYEQVKKIDGNQVEQNIENNIQLINKAVTQSGSSSGSGLGW